MFTRRPFVDFAQTESQRVRSGGMAWLLMVPGLFLTLMALAILLWPELLAYMVAGVLLFGGLSLLTWGWTMQRLQRSSTTRATHVQYHIR